MFDYVFDLQLFADAGTLVNTTTQYVNAHTGAATAFDENNTLAPELKTFYDTELLENARAEMFYEQFGKKQPLPAGHKGTVEWRKWNTFAKAEKLTEGVIPTGQKFGASAKTGSVDQYGTYVSVSDVLEMQAYDPVIMGAIEEMGASAAETQETLIRDGLLVNTNVLYCDNIKLDDRSFVSTPTTALEMEASNTVRSELTSVMVNKAVTIMKKNRVPRINGNYAAVIHPSVAHDLRNDPGWIEAHKYAAPEELFNGEIGQLHGVRFVEDTFAPVLKGADLASDSRGLKINNGSGYSGAITSVAFDGGTVAEDALIGRYISINGVVAKITDNTASSLTFASTNFGSIADNADIVPADYGAGDAAAYATYFFGKDSFGIIEAEGGGLEMIVKNKEQIGGPLNQFSTIGYKLMANGATILYPERVLRVMSASSFSAVDEAN